MKPLLSLFFPFLLLSLPAAAQEHTATEVHSRLILHPAGEATQAAVAAPDTVALIPIDTLFYVENRGLDRIVVETDTGVRFKLTADPAEAEGAANLYPMPRFGEVTIGIWAAIRTEGETRMRIAAIGPPESSANIIIADLLFTPEITHVLEPVPFPEQARLLPPYPNPARGPVTIPYEVPDRLDNGVEVELAVYDALGRRVALLERRVRYGGPFDVAWDGQSSQGFALPNGVYFARLKSGTQIATRPITLIR